MTREEKQKAIDAIKISAPVMAMTQEEFNDYIQTINQIMDWLEQKPSEDAISRQAAIDACLNGWNKDYKEIVEEIRTLPPVTPQTKQEPCDDAISRNAVLDLVNADWIHEGLEEPINSLPPVNPQKPNVGHCKDCKYFEYDSVARVDGVPLIVAHEICSRWGDGCKTSEDGYCFLYEQQESEE